MSRRAIPGGSRPGTCVRAGSSALLDSGSDPERFAVSPDGRTLYIASEDHSAVSFLDIRPNRIIREVAPVPSPRAWA